MKWHFYRDNGLWVCVRTIKHRRNRDAFRGLGATPAEAFDDYKSIADLLGGY